jgi:hypothetical protein
MCKVKRFICWSTGCWSMVWLLLLLTASGCGKQEPPAPDPDAWPSALHASGKALQHAKGMPLRLVIASKFENRVTSPGNAQYVIHEWTFLYAKSAKEFIVVSVDDNGARVNPELAAATGPGFGVSTDGGKNELVRANWVAIANYPAIKDWYVGSIRADEIAKKHGGQIQTPDSPHGKGLFFLRMGKLNGESVPYWFVPHRFAVENKLVQANTGAVEKLIPSMFE